jgi:hypothetical protein
MERDRALPDEQPRESNGGLFDLSDEMLAWMERAGATMRDAVRAVRPGGPLDSLEYLTLCNRCGIAKAEKLRWFHDREFACGCGGKFDVRPLRAFNEAVASRQKGVAEYFFHRFFRPTRNV